MNSDQVKGVLQKAGGHLEKDAGALVGDESAKEAGQENRIKGEAWGNVKEAGCALIERARAAKVDAEIKSERAKAFDREHRVEIHGVAEVGQGGVDQPDRNRAGKANRKGPRKAQQQAFDQPYRKRA
ncbi:MAG: hypothetical protein WA419_10875 [Silvibacterium sp.]